VAEREPAPASPATAFVDIALPLPVGQTFTYHLTLYQQQRVKPGARVRVPVGKRRMTGYVVATRAEPPAGFETRAIEALIDRDPVLPPDLLDLARFAADYYLAPLGDVLAAMIPAEADAWGDRRVRLTDRGAMAMRREPLAAAVQALLLEQGQLRISEIEERLDDPGIEAVLVAAIAEGSLAWDEAGARGERYEAAFELSPGEPGELRARAGRSAAGRAVIDYLAALGRPALADELREGAGCSAAVLRRLATLGILRRFSQPRRLALDRHLLAGGPGRTGSGGATDSRFAKPAFALRPDQQAALDGIEGALAAGEFGRFLLRGMTGSGKTEVYLRAAAAALAGGRSVLLLVPEIALVPALAAAARERFPEELAVLHSGLGAGERAQEWARIKTGEARLVVGPRSALFAPVTRLGLVVVDEEQDLSYKQDSSPRYQGRDLALMRAKLAGAVAVLVSATPSLETRLAVTSGRMTPLTLTERAGQGALPEGILVDLRNEAVVRLPGDVQFSERLIAEIERALADGDQTILLRNRRGYSPLLLCRACGEDFRCADCGLPRTYHRKSAQGGRGEELICHYCDSRLAAPPRCPVCRAETLEAIGAGTERIEEALVARFPGAAVDVLDRDALRRGGGPAAILERFERGETQILVGTQMVSKGHHFPRVALTGILSADSYLGFPDFRAVEKTYALLTQLGGRAGRGERPGRVVIQTFLPEHYAIRAALLQDDAAFAEQEMRFRRIFHYPPYTRMVQLLLRDKSRERGLARLSEIAGRISHHRHSGELRVTGPATAPLERLRGEWRLQLLVRGARGGVVRQVVREALGEKPLPGLAVDVDPYHLL
jgi:primosomal protein N' (replication factor Y)